MQQAREAAPERIGDRVLSILLVVFGAIGLTLGLGAKDIEILIFGWSLLGFSVIFLAGLLRGWAASAAPASAVVVAVKGKRHV